MSKSTISTFQLFALFPDEQAARVGFYHCAACNFDFTVRSFSHFQQLVVCRLAKRSLLCSAQQATELRVSRHTFVSSGPQQPRSWRGLPAECDDNARTQDEDGNVVWEYWGDDEDGNTWRVHVAVEGAPLKDPVLATPAGIAECLPEAEGGIC